MSGEAVALPIALVALPIVAVGAVAYGAGAIIKGIVDNQLEAAAHARELEKARIREWREFQDNEHRQMQIILKQYNALREIEKQLAAITLSIPEKKCPVNAPTLQGYSTLTPKTEIVPHEVLETFLYEIGSLLDNAPSEVRDTQDSPLARLKKQEELLLKKLKTSNSPLLEEIKSFRTTVEHTISGYLKSCELTRTHENMARNRLEHLFDDILTTMHITNESAVQESLDKIKSQALGVLNKRHISIGHFEHLEKQVYTIKSDAIKSLNLGAFRSTLAHSLTRNLEEMGYKSVGQFPEDPHTALMKAEMAIPGGERLRLTIDRTNQMSFRVYHESKTTNSTLTSEEKRHFRDQEKKWCQDLKELIRRLTKEGFTYSLGAERLIPDMSIPVVVVENAEQIISQQNEQEVKRLRQHIQAEQARKRF